MPGVPYKVLAAIGDAGIVIGKLSLVRVGMRSHSEDASSIFNTLADD